MLKDKKVIVLGDKDGITAAAVEECVKTAGAEVIFAVDGCYVCTVAGAMEPENQKKVLALSEEFSKENLVVVLGIADAEAAGLTAETVTAGDPTEMGPLAGISLGLSVYHLFELKEHVDAQTYKSQCGTMEMLLDVDEIINEVQPLRQKHSRF